MAKQRTENRIDLIHSKITEEECQRMVGEFMQTFSFLEDKINRIIKDIADLNTVEGTILIANISFRDKSNSLKTLLNFFLIAEKDRKIISTIFKKIEKVSTYRNQVAHNMFWASDDGSGLVFGITKSKGDLSMPDIVWTKNDFKNRIGEIENIISVLGVKTNHVIEIKKILSNKNP
jgi:hypothetical protein